MILRLASTVALALHLTAAPIASSAAFAPPRRAAAVPASTLRYRSRTDDDNDSKGQWDVPEEVRDDALSPRGKFNFPNPLAELSDMLSNLDDVVDDFYNKRMGNGEVFYGKRKYKPSGRVAHDYNGGGLSDWRKMEAARLFREERALQRALRGELKE